VVQAAAHAPQIDDSAANARIFIRNFQRERGRDPGTGRTTASGKR
jgi:hypothetical protein